MSEPWNEGNKSSHRMGPTELWDLFTDKLLLAMKVSSAVPESNRRKFMNWSWRKITLSKLWDSVKQKQQQKMGTTNTRFQYNLPNSHSHFGNFQTGWMGLVCCRPEFTKPTGIKLPSDQEWDTPNIVTSERLVNLPFRDGTSPTLVTALWSPVYRSKLYRAKTGHTLWLLEGRALGKSRVFANFGLVSPVITCAHEHQDWEAKDHVQFLFSLPTFWNSVSALTATVQLWNLRAISLLLWCTCAPLPQWKVARLRW